MKTLCFTRLPHFLSATMAASRLGLLRRCFSWSATWPRLGARPSTLASPESCGPWPCNFTGTRLCRLCTYRC